MFVLSQCDVCSPTRRFCTTWMAICKGPIVDLLQSTIFASVYTRTIANHIYSKERFPTWGINSTFLVFNLECNLTHERLVISYAADYASFHEMYDALVVKKEVEGILADIYTASYYMEKVGDSRLAVTMFFTSQRSIGFAVGRQDFKSHSTCLRNLFKYRQRDIKKIILRHTQALHVSHV